MMRITKILVLLVLLFALAIPFASCGATEDTSSIQPSSEAESSETSFEASSETESGETSSESSSKTETDSTLRVMSYNILHPEWGGVSVDSRKQKIANVFKEYAPDVIGVQEVCREWHDALKPLIVDTEDYLPVAQKVGGTYNLTTMFYNPKTVTLIEEFVLPLKANTDLRVVAGGVFEKDGKQFIVINTHPDTPLNENSTYASDIENIIKHIEELKKEYEGLPIIMTGDYNSPKELDILYTGYKDIVSNLGVSDVRDVAENIINNYETMPGLYGTPTLYEGGMSIKIVDYIFVTQDVTVENFGVAIDDKLTWVSDHLPIYADIILE